MRAQSRAGGAKTPPLHCQSDAFIKVNNFKQAVTPSLHCEAIGKANSVAPVAFASTQSGDIVDGATAILERHGHFRPTSQGGVSNDRAGIAHDRRVDSIIIVARVRLSFGVRHFQERC